MTRYAKATPASVRRAVAIYVARRRAVGVSSSLLLGAAGAAAIAVAFILADRYGEWSVGVRASGPWLALLSLAAGVVGAVAAVLRPHDPFRVAVRLDRAFPQHQDRWSSSLDLAEQADAGKHVGDRASVDRLLADTESLPAGEAGTLVPRRAIWLSLAV